MRNGRWKATAFVLIALEAAAVFWLYYALNLGNTIRGLASDDALLAILQRALAAIRHLIPRPVADLSAQFVSSSGLESPLRTLALRGAVLGSGTGVSSFGSAFVAPVYFAARRLVRRPSATPSGSVRRRLTGRKSGAKAKVLEPFVRPSTAVQESL